MSRVTPPRQQRSTAAAPSRSGGPARGVRAESAWLAWVLLVVGAGFLVFARLRWLNVPLERDEGEFAYAGQLLLHGIPPYKLACNMKLPGTYLAYAALMAVFGRSIAGVHLGLLLVDALAAVFVWVLGRRAFGALGGAAAAATWAVLSVSSAVVGMAAHATHFVVLSALGAFVLLFPRGRPPRPLEIAGGGALVGLAILAKQPGALLLGPALYLSCAGTMDRTREAGGARAPLRACVARCGLLLAGCAAPLLLVVAWLAWAGVLDRFWFWTVRYAGAYVAEVGLAKGLSNLGENGGVVLRASPLLWALAAAGLVVLLRVAFGRGRADGPDAERPARNARFVLLLVGFAFLATCPGLYFRGHYFVVLLPAAVLAVGAAVSAAGERDQLRGGRTWTALTVALVLVGLGTSAWHDRGLLSGVAPADVSHIFYGENPFPESVEIGAYLARHAAPGDRVAVLGSEPQIYFYSGLRSATGSIYVYGLVEEQPYAARMQEDMIREIEDARPEYVVYVEVNASWMRKNGAPTRLFEWMDAFVPQHYDIVGIVDVPPLGRGPSRYRWDAEARGQDPDSPCFILVGRRRPERANP